MPDCPDPAAQAEKAHEPIPCPHCGEPLSLEFVSQFMERHRIALAIYPKDGDMLGVDTVGGCLTNFAKLMKEIGKSFGERANVIVERLETGADGSVTLHALIANHQPKRQRKEPRNAP